MAKPIKNTYITPTRSMGTFPGLYYVVAGYMGRESFVATTLPPFFKFVTPGSFSRLSPRYHNGGDHWKDGGDHWKDGGVGHLRAAIGLPPLDAAFDLVAEGGW
eukprot:Lankesteria_metandrocarpae@DN2139_c0_g1_i1.p1